MLSHILLANMRPHSRGAVVLDPLPRSGKTRSPERYYYYYGENLSIFTNGGVERIHTSPAPSTACISANGSGILAWLRQLGAVSAPRLWLTITWDDSGLPGSMDWSSMYSIDSSLPVTPELRGWLAAGRAASSQPAPPVLTVRLTTLWAVPVGSALNTLGSRPCLSLLVAVSIGELMANDEAGRWLGQPNRRIGPGGPVDSDARGTVEHHCIRESLVQTKILLSNHRLVSACSCLLSLPGSRLFPCVHRAPLVARVRDISC